MTRKDTIQKIEGAAEAAAQPAGIEIVEVELKGSGRNQLLRIVIDKTEGVTHGDCEAISRAVSDSLDMDDPIEGSYQLEVTSPGVERKLTRWREWERFQGKSAKVVLREPVEELKHFDGTIVSASEGSITMELKDGRRIAFAFENIERANLRFEW